MNNPPGTLPLYPSVYIAIARSKIEYKVIGDDADDDDDWYY
jgi:hypothetical protein